ncbi:protein kinase C and casein kinase substrate in neurons protein 2-like isoform X2 [Mizuhopecten yessoensis]|uniref:Protein kinase C and casein kinase substrate in neurons protein 2 n=1 Tax=Mizuhopecten yessoensis TaxID=6573 RepID=A0A210QTA4_MIZYE|nr:protein kinase C and casein kinase substrate in neurons protein 2-like isoform X2 [Mizuhopecten yessoensis]OWF51969.1 Protein kinase C and casein kinase substrate in neurons protein 2 [Mizuhopecten yessoensis]
MTNYEESIQPSSDSFWEVGKYQRTVKRVDNGHKMCESLRSLIESRSEIEKNYAKQLSQWTKRWNEYLDKGPEYATTQGAWRGLLEEADSVANLHTLVGENLMSKAYADIKQWQKDNYHKSLMHFKETKEMEDGFKKAQKPWEKKYTKLQAAKKEYHTACRNEKTTANQENNARGDSAVSQDQLKKIQDKLRKYQADVEQSKDKYEACLNDLNGYNAKYIEDMNEVFEKCQNFERERMEFFKKTMFVLHECLDLSSEPRFSKLYSDLHDTISKADSDSDLAWWSQKSGADMPMNWPTFEEYSPDLANISKKEKKSQLGGDGITITSIRHKGDVYQPSTDTNSFNNSSPRTSRTSNTSNTHSDTHNDTYQPVPSQQESSYSSNVVETRAEVDVSRKKSYDEKLNPFGSDDDDDTDLGGDRLSSKTPTKQTVPEQVRLETASTPNPFEDEEDGAECHIEMEVLYDYIPKSEDDDELTLTLGEKFIKIKMEDELGWCKGRKLNGCEGLFPAQYARELS